MINIKVKKGLLYLLLVVLLFGTTIMQGVGTSEEETGPIPIERPQGIMLQNTHNRFLWLIRNMKSANFTPDNVYFGVYDNVGSFNYPIVGERIRNVTLELAPLKDLLEETIQRLGPTHPAFPFLSLVYTQLLDHSKINIYHEADANLMVTSAHDRKAVTIFYDNDQSVLEAFDKIKNNESLTSQPFTGDEILTNILMTLARDTITGTYEVRNEWTYEDGSDGTLLKRFIDQLTSHRWLTRELKYLFNLGVINIMRTMVGPEHYIFDTGSVPKVLERGSFSVSQLRIDELTLHRVGDQVLVKDYDYKYIEHHLLGNLVYNDTNGNGYMDIGVKNATIGRYNIVYPTIGDEAKFRLDTKTIGQRSYQKPTTTNNLLEFGSNFTDVQGYLQPFEKTQDETLFNESMGQMYNIDEVSTLFHFSVNNTESSVDLKFDYVIGNWNNNEQLEGLGFNQLFASTVVDAKQKKVIKWEHENGTELNDDYETASKISRFRFAEAQELFGEIRLDDIPYIWNGDTEVNAVGQLIPMNLIDITYGVISSQADMLRGIRGGAMRKTFLYSVSYPKWDGKSITHDPAYAAFGGQAATASTTSETQPPETSSDGRGIPGFEFSAILLTVPILALIEVYRRKYK
ncbi:MAG: hypothetical protein ACFFAE_03900 [Candidatus Hodarchaeota archaeon]